MQSVSDLDKLLHRQLDLMASKSEPSDSSTGPLTPSETDGTPLKRNYAGEHVKKYFPRMPGGQQTLDHLTDTTEGNAADEVDE